MVSTDTTPEQKRKVALIVCGRYADDIPTARLLLEILGITKENIHD